MLCRPKCDFFNDFTNCLFDTHYVLGSSRWYSLEKNFHDGLEKLRMYTSFWRCCISVGILETLQEVLETVELTLN